MKKFLYPVVLLLVAFTYVSCENYETYADKKEAERDAIDRFIAREGIQVIDDAQFKAQNNTTDVSKNSMCASTAMASTCRLSVRAVAIRWRRTRPSTCSAVSSRRIS